VGAACATGGTAGGWAEGAGMGATMVAPGDPIPGAGAGAVVDWGPTRLCTCAAAALGSMEKPTPATETAIRTANRSAATALRQKPLNTRPPIRIFLKRNRGNFKPRTALVWPNRTQSLAKLQSRSPYLG